MEWKEKKNEFEKAFFTSRQGRRTSPNKRSFRSPGGVVRGLDYINQAKICARELASVVSRGLRGASRGLPLTMGRTKYIVPKFQIRQ